MQLFYSPGIQEGVNTLDGDQSQHCVRVLRKKQGDTLHITDGEGNLYRAVVTVADPKRCVVEARLERKECGRRPFSVHMAVAPTKNTDRFEWFVEKATEIGVDRITPLECERSERRVLKRDRCERVAIEAMKQSVKAYLPSVDELTAFAQLLKSVQAEGKYIAHCSETGQRRPLKELCAGQANVAVLIGPEGDFSPGEVAAAKAHGFVEVSLGPSRLRTETAALVAVHTVNLMNQ